MMFKIFLLVVVVATVACRSVEKNYYEIVDIDLEGKHEEFEIVLMEENVVPLDGQSRQMFSVDETEEKNEKKSSCVGAVTLMAMCY